MGDTESLGPNERARRAGQRADELRRRLERFHTDSPSTAQDVSDAASAAVAAAELDRQAHRSAARAHRRAAGAHDRAAALADTAGHPERGDEHRTAADADRQAALADDAQADEVDG